MPESLVWLQNVYSKMSGASRFLRKKLGRPLTLSEKILASHVMNLKKQDFTRGVSYLTLQPDRVAMQDATAQMALLQFMLAGKDSVAVPTTVHCDHLIIAGEGARKDTAHALQLNHEVYDFLRAASRRYGIGFWQPGAGIIHQIILENYAFPGGLMIGTDSHTPNAGGLGMLAIGVGGADASDVMSGLPWEVKCPKLIGVYLKGQLNGWASAKDVILKLCGMLTTKGGTDKIVEYIGPGARSISCTGKATITNMGAELGATTSVFPYDERMSEYLSINHRNKVAALAKKYREFLVPDPEVEKNPKKYYDQVIEIDLTALEPYVVGPHTPDLARPISQFAKETGKKRYPAKLCSALIGSCTNSSYEDLGRAAHIARQAAKAGMKAKCPFFISPGSDQIQNTIQRDGQLAALKKIGGVVLANACGPCIGQWKREDIQMGEANSIMTSFNRNFPGRNDGNAQTLAFIGSPEMVTACALAGRIDFNPAKDVLRASNGKSVRLSPPVSRELPSKGFAGGKKGCVAPLPQTKRKGIQVVIDEKSPRLQQLKPFSPWNGKDFEDLYVLIKAKGKCTTDHISPAGAWLRFRGHLDKISDNLLLGANNEFTGETGKAKNWLRDGKIMSPAEAARDYQRNGFGWVIIGDENYGEGSSREHAAMSPRFLGCQAVIAKSFARIHETNLKKQGLLPLMFKNPKNYDKINDRTLVSIKGLTKFAPGGTLTLVLLQEDESTETVELVHSFTDEQIKWFKAGSALNLMRGQK